MQIAHRLELNFCGNIQSQFVTICGTQCAINFPATHECIHNISLTWWLQFNLLFILILNANIFNEWMNANYHNNLYYVLVYRWCLSITQCNYLIHFTLVFLSLSLLFLVPYDFKMHSQVLSSCQRQFLYTICQNSSNNRTRTQIRNAKFRKCE